MPPPRVTEALPTMHTATLIQPDGNHHWASNRAAMTDLVNHLAASPTKTAQTLQQEAAMHVAPFGDHLRSVSLNAFLQILAGEDDPKRPIHRIPFIHWLLGWHARHRNSVLRCQIIPNDTDSVLPAPCPLSAQQWNAELNNHRAALTFPGVLSRISFRRAELADLGSSSAEPLWKKMLLHKDTAHPSDFTVDIQRLAALPDDKAEHIAQAVRVLGSDMALPESATATLRAVKSARALASAVKTVWLASSTPTYPSLQSSLLDLINIVEEQHGSTGLEDQRLAALRALDPLVDAAAARPGVAWSTLAATLLAVCPTVVPAEAVATYLSVQGPISYRVAVSSAVHTIPHPQGLDHLVAQTQRTLEGGVQLSSHLCPVRVAYNVCCPCHELLRAAASCPDPAPVACTPSPWVWPPDHPPVFSRPPECPRNQ